MSYNGWVVIIPFFKTEQRQAELQLFQNICGVREWTLGESSWLSVASVWKAVWGSLQVVCNAGRTSQTTFYPGLYFSICSGEPFLRVKFMIHSIIISVQSWRELLCACGTIANKYYYLKSAEIFYYINQGLRCPWHAHNVHSFVCHLNVSATNWNMHWLIYDNNCVALASAAL